MTMVKFGQIAPEDVFRAQRGDKEAVDKVLDQSVPVVYQLLSARKYTPQITTEEDLRDLVTVIRDFIESQVIPSYSIEREDFSTFLWDSVKMLLTQQSREQRRKTNKILTEDVLAAQEGDAPALDFVIQSLDPIMKGLITRHPEYVRWVESKEDMEDLLQHLREYIIRRGIPEFNPARGKAATYLHRVIQNELIDEGKRKMVERRQMGGPPISFEAPISGEVEESLSGIIPDPTTEGIVPFLPQLYEAARAQLDDFALMLLDMRLQGMSFKEMVEVLKQRGVTTQTGREIREGTLTTYFDTKIKPILRQYIFGVPPEQKPRPEEPPEALSEEASKLLLVKTTDIDVIAFLRLYLFER